MPYALTTKQKEQRLNHAYDLIETIKSHPKFLNSIITAGVSHMIWKQNAQAPNGVIQTLRPLVSNLKKMT